LIGVWPARQVLGNVHDVLHPIEDDRSYGADIEEALHPQYVFTTSVQQHAEPDTKGHPIEWLVKGQRDGTDVCGMGAILPWDTRRRRTFQPLQLAGTPHV
jgi:hypothetical protein